MYIWYNKLVKKGNGTIVVVVERRKGKVKERDREEGMSLIQRNKSYIANGKCGRKKKRKNKECG